MKDLLIKLPPLSEMTQTRAQASQRIRHRFLYPARHRSLPPEGPNQKQVEKYTIHFVRTTTPSHIIALIWKLLMLSRRHENLHETRFLPGTQE